ITKDILDNRPFNHERYVEFYPLRKPDNLIKLGTGGTPFVRANKIAKKIGVKNLFLKLESMNPSGSFKDRPISVGVSKAKEIGSTTVTAASSGNAAAALATYAARSNLDAVVFVPEHAPNGKIAQLTFLGAKVIKVSVVKEGEDPTVTLFKKAYKEYNWTPSPSFGPFNPFQFEGTKSLGFEICEQSKWQVPDWVICNTGSGGLLAGTFQGFVEFQKLDFVDSLPKMIAVQPAECAPIVNSVKKKVQPLDFIDWTKTPNTVAGGLADPHPWDGNEALEAIYESQGTAVAVNEPDILRTQRWLAADEGIFGEPSGTAALAGLELLVDDGTIDPSDFIVLPITGTGFKDPEVVFENVTFYNAITPDLDKLKQLLEHISKKLIFSN
ncbi:MAG: threonine synthase, partial [Candidatus Hodarchaeales archaeon]